MTAPLTTLSWTEHLDVQSGVLARRQALDGGLTPHAWAWKHRSGRWTRLLPGVALAQSGEPSDIQVAWAALLHCGDGAALTGDWALHMSGFRFRERPERVHVAVPETRAVRRAVVGTGQPLVVVPQQVRGLDRLRHPARRPPVLRLPVAALHAAAQAPSDRAAEWRMLAVVQQRLTTARQLQEALDALPRLRRRRLLRVALLEAAEGAQASSELDFLHFLRRRGLPRPDRLQRRVRAAGTRYLDAWWERPRVGAEIDGTHHVEVGQWDADVLRANAIVVAERHDRILLLRFTTGNLRHDADAVEAQLRSVLIT